MAKLISVSLIIIMAALTSVGSPTEKQKTAKEEKKIEASEKKKTAKKTDGKYKGELGDFYFRDADLKNVLLYFAKTYKFNIVLDPGISGKVTCRLIRVPWDQALSVILRQHGLAMAQNGNVVSVIDLNKFK